MPRHTRHAPIRRDETRESAKLQNWFARERWSHPAPCGRACYPKCLLTRPAFCEPQALGARGIIVEDVLLKSVKLPDQLTRVRTIHLCNTCACVCLLLHRHVASPRHPARTYSLEGTQAPTRQRGQGTHTHKLAIQSRSLHARDVMVLSTVSFGGWLARTEVLLLLCVRFRVAWVSQDALLC